MKFAPSHRSGQNRNIIDSSGKLCHKSGMKKGYADRVGERGGSLTLIGIEGVWNRSTWGNFRCDCGSEKVIRLYAVFGPSAKTTSCGCLKSALTTQRNLRHGHTGTDTYESWAAMKARCHNPNNPAYPRYGGRGIRICDGWAFNYESFLRDMGERPSGMSLDRIDVNGPYSPENCRWATDKQQAANRRSTKHITYDGRTMCVRDWVAEIGISRSAFQARLDGGMPADKVVEYYLKRASSSSIDTKLALSTLPPRKRKSAIPYV